MKYFLFAGLHFMLTYVAFNAIGYIFPSVLSSCGVCNVVRCLIISFLTFGFTRRQFLDDIVDSTNKAIFITGCDTGFGHNLAKRMDSRGYHVFAGCLFPSGPDANTLKESCSERLKIVELDVTKDSSVERAAEFVKENLDSRELWAIVNNAGILKGFNVEVSELKEFQDTMEVNGFGPVRVTKAFLPLLKQTKGRVITVTSYVGRTVIPYTAPYCMSKFAAVAFSDCLRQELADYGIRVIGIEPELFLTNLTNKKIIDEKMNKARESEKTLKADDADKVFKRMKKVSDAFLYFSTPKIHLVVDALEQAITSKYPATIYKPIRGNWFAHLVLRSYEYMPIDARDLCIRILTLICSRL